VNLLEKLAHISEKIITWWIVSTLAVMVLTIVCDVILRETLDSPLVWNLEVAQSCLINITYVGAALAFRRRAHISINVVTARLPVKVERWVDVIARCLVLPFLGILTYSGLLVVQHARGVTPTLRLPIWMYYFPILIGSIFLCFFGVIQILEAIKAARLGVGLAEKAEAPKGAV
jgi:TRAP-type C4-dicarboxylate transport system permease small subunit